MELLYQLQIFREQGPSVINTLFVVISEGSLFLIPVFAAVIYWCYDKRRGEKIMLALAFANLLSNLLKILCCIYRPWIRNPRLHPAAEAVGNATGYSFPSSHSAAAASVSAAAALSSRRKRRAMTAAVLFTLAVMFSRLYLGCHTPADVAAGAAAGVSMAFLSVTLSDRIGEDRKKYRIFLAAALSAAAAVLAAAALKRYPMDYNAAGELLVDPLLMQNDAAGAAGVLAGMCIGLFIERRWICFALPAGRKQRLLRTLAGAALCVLFHVVIMKKLTASMNPFFAKFLRYFVTGFIGTAGYPLLFSRFRSRFRTGRHT